MADLENLTVDSFNFDTMKADLGVDPFATAAKKYEEDSRFYKLTRDKETGAGIAVIRFLPDSERTFVQEISRINTTIEKNGKKRFVNELTPSAIGLPCPFQEEWQRLWNSGEKEEAKRFGRGKKYLANIKVIKDPAKPENEGKIFLLEMSAAMKDKIYAALNPSDADKALGEEPKELFNPLRGNSFKLSAKVGANGMVTYDSSAVIEKVDSIYANIEDAIKDIKENTYKLSDFKKPENFLSYDELLKKFKWVTFADTEVQAAPKAEVQEINTQAAQTATEATVEVKQEPVAKPKDDLDDLLASLA